MNIEEFFVLPEEEQERIVKVHKQRQDIVRQYNGIKMQEKELAAELLALQYKCPHLNLDSITSYCEDEYGRSQPAWNTTKHKCPDCKKEWKTDAKGRNI